MFACSNAFMTVAVMLVEKGAATDAVEDVKIKRFYNNRIY
jgi:hypothetical protein